MQSIILSNLVLSFPHAQKKKGFQNTKAVYDNLFISIQHRTFLFHKPEGWACQ